MSVDTLRDLKMLPESESENDISSNKSVCQRLIQHSTESLEEKLDKNTSDVTATSMNGNTNGSSEAEAASLEVEYIESENLDDVEDLDSSLKTLLGGLESKDWIVVCEALNSVRRLSLFHKELLGDMLENALLHIAKSLKNPRSAVCKTAVMTCADIFRTYSDHIIDSLDPLLVQLLLKSSQDKRFVCEAAERTLEVMTAWISPTLLLPKLQSYLKNRNPRIRAKASMCICRSVLRLGADGIKRYGIDKLIRIAASQLSDQLPESREAARTLLLELHSVYHYIQSMASLSEDQEIKTWQHFCQSNLAPLSAQAVVQVTNVAGDGAVMRS